MWKKETQTIYTQKIGSFRRNWHRFTQIYFCYKSNTIILPKLILLSSQKHLKHFQGIWWEVDYVEEEPCDPVLLSSKIFLSVLLYWTSVCTDSNFCIIWILLLRNFCFNYRGLADTCKENRHFFFLWLCGNMCFRSSAAFWSAALNHHVFGQYWSPCPTHCWQNTPAAVVQSAGNTLSYQQTLPRRLL